MEKKGSTGPQKEPTEKTERYVSIDPDEHAILKTLGLRERWLYMELKWMSNWKTGWVQKWRNMEITYQRLADSIHVPASQGRPEQKIDAKEATRLLMRLHAAGLVGEIENDAKTGLRFALPMSPIKKKEASEQRSAERQTKAENPPRLPNEPAILAARLPNEPSFESGENQEPMRVSDGSADSLSVMMMNNIHQYPFNNTDAAGVRPAASARSSVAGDLLESPGSAAPVEVRGATASAPTVAAIKAVLHASRSEFSWVGARESEIMYRRWIKAGHGLEKIKAAIATVEDDFTITPTPKAVDDELHHGQARMEQRMRDEQRAKRRGGVAL